MKKSFSVSVVSPIFNNATTLTTIIPLIDKCISSITEIYEILLIDDGSKDDSFSIAQKLSKTTQKLRVLKHNTNQGISKTYRDLYRLAKYDNIVLFSLDGEWEIQDIKKLLQTALETDADIVIGKREKKAYSPVRMFISSVYNYLTKSIFRIPTYDAGSIKYVKKHITNIPIISHGVFDEAERIIKAKKMGYTISVIPVSHYASKKTKSFFIKPFVLLEALSDFIRVYFSILKEQI